MRPIRSIDLELKDLQDPRAERSTRRHARVRSRRVLSIALGLAIALSGVAAAEPFAYNLSSELMSPFCPGRTLASCPSPQAAELVQWMVVQEAGGATREQVIAMLIEDYGEEILGAPPAKGITLWAYIFPVLGFLVGGVIAFFVLRRIVAGAAATPADTLPLPAAGADPLAAAVPTRSGAASPSPAIAESGADESDQDDLARIVDAELAFRD